MNIVIKYLGIGLEGLPIKQFRNILAGQDSISVKMTGKGILLLSNKIMIKCVKDYYRLPNTDNASKIKASNQCYYSQRDLNIEGVENYACVRCHSVCIDAYERRDLILK